MKSSTAWPGPLARTSSTPTPKPLLPSPSLPPPPLESPPVKTKKLTNAQFIASLRLLLKEPTADLEFILRKIKSTKDHRKRLIAQLDALGIPRYTIGPVKVTQAV